MLKRNFLTGKFVFFSPERANRPYCQNNKDRQKYNQKCPFCIENRDMTPQSEYTAFNEEIRLIENKYPIFDKSGEFYGVHYVLIDTKSHKKDIMDYTEDHLFYLMRAFKDASLMISKDENIKHIQIFKNKGCRAGASQEHSHWQVMGFSVVPREQENIYNQFNKYKKETNKCYLCSLNLDKNIVSQNNNFIAFCPDDSLYSYEIDIMPKEHITNVMYLNDEQLQDMGNILQQSLLKLSKIYKNLEYNICFHGSLLKKDIQHLFLQIIPRMGNLGGFEFSTNMFVNSILPSIAAKNLRSV